jgi:hypothetical protein
LETLEEMSQSEDVLKVSDDYTGISTGTGASHDPREFFILVLLSLLTCDLIRIH